MEKDKMNKDNSDLRIKEILKERGMTLTTLASEIGITVGTLSAMISGNPTLNNLRKVANALDCDIKELFK